jgi:hypothetical protein
VTAPERRAAEATSAVGTAVDSDGIDWANLRRTLAGPGVLVTYAVLVLPLAAAWNDTDRMTPLALPGYVIYTVGSAVGNAFAPNYGLAAYWIPFLVGCYGVAVAVAGVFRALWR